MKTNFQVAVSLFVALFIAEIAWTDFETPITKEAYLQEKGSLAYKDQLDFALSTLTKPAEDAAYDEALNDIERITKVQKNAESVLPAVEAFLDSAEAGSASFEKAWLVRARLLCRAGNVEEGSRLFREGMLERGWSNAFAFYIDTLEELGQYARAAAEEFNLACDPRVVDHKGRNFLDFLLHKLMIMKHENPDAGATEEVLPLIATDDDHPEYHQIAQALCLIADEDYSGAVDILTELNDSYGSEWGVEGEAETGIYSEYRNLPAYISAALFIEGDDYDQARIHLAEFWSRNPERPEYVLKVGLRIVRCLEAKIGWPTAAWVELTEWLDDAGFADDHRIRKHIGDEWIAHFLDLHQMALFVCDRWQEQKQVCERLFTEFDLNYPGSISGTYWLGHILFTQDRELKKAEGLFLRIIEETNYPTWITLARKDLLGIWKQTGEPKEKLLAVVEELKASAATEEEKERWENQAERIKRRRR